MAKKYDKPNGSIKKQSFKRVAACCQICEEGPYEVLEVHRIIPGSEGGKYTKLNSVSICSNCHALVTAGKIEICGWLYSTKGWLLHYIDIEGEEKFV